MSSVKGKVAVALSGGVDSSVAAALAVREGYEVIALTLRLKHPDAEFSQAQLCASKSDEEAIEKVIRTLGIRHVYLDGFEDFKEKVLRVAEKEYLCGRTPNPCCICNCKIKFGILADFAAREGCSALLTGHYAEIREENGIFSLYRGEDARKDQSYFLYRLNQKELSMLRFPVGVLEKSRVRELAAQFGLPTAEKPDSQDACFQVPGEPFGETLRRLFGDTARRGVFRYRGKIVGTHNGVHNYTIGQRKGLNVALGVPAYIKNICADNAEIELETDPDALLAGSFTVKDVSAQSGITPDWDGKECLVQVRYRSLPVKAKLCREGKLYRVVPEHPLRAVTPGQAAVFYEDRKVLGGGVIENAD